MRECKYLKKKSRQMLTGTFEGAESSEKVFEKKFNLKRTIVLFAGVFFTIALFLVVFVCNNLKQVSVSELAAIQPISASIASANVKRTIIEIPVGTVKANPFLPYKETGMSVVDNGISRYDLIEPPEESNQNSEAARVMRTVVSGILYDRYSPSAILNIEGSDYLVKKGDVVNNYNVLNIARDAVTVKLGENVYKAGIGELLTDGTIHHNDVSNLNNKFGGENNGVQ